jgi:hypothetical protein
MYFWLARIDMEATVILVICLIFLALFVIAGVREKLQH